MDITIKGHGPYLISAEQAHCITIRDSEGRVYVPEPGRAIALCRCGASATKPFCDKSHRRVTWQSALVPTDPPA